MPSALPCAALLQRIIHACLPLPGYILQPRSCSLLYCDFYSLGILTPSLCLPRVASNPSSLSPPPSSLPPSRPSVFCSPLSLTSYLLPLSSLLVRFLLLACLKWPLPLKARLFFVCTDSRLAFLDLSFPISGARPEGMAHAHLVCMNIRAAASGVQKSPSKGPKIHTLGHTTSK